MTVPTRVLVVVALAALAALACERPPDVVYDADGRVVCRGYWAACVAEHCLNGYTLIDWQDGIVSRTYRCLRAPK